MDEFGVPKLYYIEGLDCTGKDTIGGILAQKKNARIGKLALCEDNPWNIDKTGLIPSGHPLFSVYILKMVIWDLMHFELREDFVQISLSGVRSAAWQSARSEPLLPLYIELFQDYPIFSRVILLRASLEEKKKRLLERKKNNGNFSSVDRLVFTDPQFVENMDHILVDIMQEYFGATIISTDSLSIHEVESLALETVSQAPKALSSKVRSYQRELLKGHVDHVYGELLKHIEDLHQKGTISDDERFEVMKIFQL